MKQDLVEIEQKFGFTYPDIYKQLSSDGMLNWGVDYGPAWYATYKLITH